jgi:rhodanese-related sulfurtransferase
VLLVVLTFTVFGVLAGCSDEPAKEEENGAQDAAPAAQPIIEEFSSLLPQEAFALREREKELLVVDVRTPEELELLRIPGSIAMPMMDLMQGRSQLPKDKPVLLVCAVGGRSYAAGLYLVKEKYLRVYNLRGGISAWQKAGLPIEYGRK